jgi:hypothetical protein
MKEDQIKVDLSADVGILASRVKYQYPTYMICNNISPICLKILRKTVYKLYPLTLATLTQRTPFPKSTLMLSYPRPLQKTRPRKKPQNTRIFKAIAIPLLLWNH